MSTTTELAPLTREQLKALRKKGRIIFYHRPTWATITAVEVTDKRGADGQAIEIRTDIPVQSTVKEIDPDYDSLVAGRKPLHEVAHCTHMEWNDHAGHTAQYIRTITKLLKVGDRLELTWGRGYENNGNTKDAKLCKDRLTLIVNRGDETMHFIIPTPVCRNDTARTVRRGQNNNE